MTKKDYEALATFRYTLRRFFRASEQKAKENGLTIRQYQALLTIKGFPEGKNVRIGDIAEWLQIVHHSAVGLVDRLEKTGLVKRYRGHSDAREVFIRITSKGARVLEKIAGYNLSELRRLRPHGYLLQLIGERNLPGARRQRG